MGYSSCGMCISVCVDYQKVYGPGFLILWDMKRMILASALIFCMILAGFPAVVSADDLSLEPLPYNLKEPSDGAVYEDEKYFSIADPAIKALSNRTIPIGTQRMTLQSAYVNLRDMRVSAENYDKAQAALAYLYYSWNAGEAYDTYLNVKESVASISDGSAYYDLAQIYYTTAEAWWALIAAEYPKVTMYSFPDKDEVYPDELSSVGTVLEGLKYPVLLVQKEPNSTKPYEDEKVKTTVSRWLEDNLDVVMNKSDLDGVSRGGYFIMGDALKDTKSTYIELTMKNVNPDFYDTANYVNAFFYYLSLARENYDKFLSERRSLMLATDGQKSYDTAKAYYDEARVAHSLFKDAIPGVNATLTLPEFPRVDEVERGKMTEQEQLLNENWGGSWK